MNRKTILIIVALLLILAAILAYMLWRGSIPEAPADPLIDGCLILQSADPSKPCYNPSSGTVEQPSSSGPVDQVPGTQAGATSSALVMPDECGTSGSTFERNDCVTKKAAASKSSALCGLVEGTLAQSACLRDIGSPVSVAVPQQNLSYEAFLRSTSSIAPILPQGAPASSSTATSPSFTAPRQDVRFTPEGLIQRFKDSPLALFGISPYQVKPGGTVKLLGTGFGDANDIHASGYLISTSSSDGFTLSFPAPASPGEYDIWVTNSKGSSQVAGRIMKLTVTENPAPLPVITSVTPNPAKYGDTIVISGTGFSNINVVSTTLGIMENAASSGNAISLRLSDLSLASKIREIPYMKDRKTAVLIYMQSEGGISEEPYSFDVQF